MFTFFTFEDALLVQILTFPNVFFGSIGIVLYIVYICR